MRKILITGGHGYIGSHVVLHMLAIGYEPKDLIVLDRDANKCNVVLPKGIASYRVDLRNADDVERIFVENKVGVVMHFASLIDVAASFEHPGEYFRNNVMGGINLLEAMVRYRCKKILFSSSCAVYGRPISVPIKENDPCSPINPYGESKLFFERILEWYLKIHGVSSIRLRYFNAAGAAYGIGECHDPEAHLIPLVVKAAYGKGDAIYVYGTDYPTPDGTCIRDYVHVLDLADAHIRAVRILIQKQSSFTDVFNIGTGNGASVKRVIDLVKKETGKHVKVLVKKRREGDPSELLADYSKARDVLGWKPVRSIDDIIRDAAKWHKKQYAED